MQIHPRRALLREHTATAHAALEGAIGSFDSLANYKAYLRGMHGFRTRIEAALAPSPAPGWLGGWRCPSLAPLLRADMDDLGLAPDSGRSPPMASIPSDAGSLLGTLYVLEGSALGARVLLRRALTLGLADTHGARHLGQQAAEPGRWPEFLALLEQAPAVDLDQAVAAANAAFAAARQAFASTADA